MADKNFINDVPKEILDDFIHEDENGLNLSIKVKASSKKERFSILSTNELLLSVNAQAIDNKANERVIELLAQILKLPKSKIKIVAGFKSSQKRIFIKK